MINKEDTIFIAGHNGMVGSAIKRILKRNNYRNVIKANRQELDLTNFESVYHWFKNFTPDVVILAAAKVGGIEANSKYPVEFILENLKIQNHGLHKEIDFFLHKVQPILDK